MADIAASQISIQKHMRMLRMTIDLLSGVASSLRLVPLEGARKKINDFQIEAVCVLASNLEKTHTHLAEKLSAFAAVEQLASADDAIAFGVPEESRMIVGGAKHDQAGAAVLLSALVATGNYTPDMLRLIDPSVDPTSRAAVRNALSTFIE